MANSNPTSYTIESDTITFTSLSNPTGYTFDSWSPTSITSGSTGNKTVVASWSLVTYNITYESGNANVDIVDITHSNPSTYTIESSTITFTSPSSVPTGYEFVSWTPNSITSGSSGNITVTANLNDITYNITYESGNANVNIVDVSHSNPNTYTIESNTITFTAPSSVPNGYDFTGWSPTSITSGSTGNAIITANFSATVYSITYESSTNGVDITQVTHSNPLEYTIEDSITFTAPTSIPNGYDFGGWNPESIAVGTTSDITVVGTFTFEATITINVSFDSTTEAQMIAFIKLSDTTNLDVWTYALTDAATHSFTIYRPSEFTVELIDPTNHATDTDLQNNQFNILESNNNVVINVVISKTQNGYIYNTYYVN